MPKLKALVAYVNHGRWLVDCPCGNGVIVNPDDKDPVDCLLCHRTYAVSWPAPQSRSAALKVLAVRPTANRNWFPDRESVADLRAENKAHGH